MSKYVITAIVAVFMMVGLVTDSESKGGKGKWEAEMIPFGSNSSCGEVKIRGSGNLKLEVSGSTCAPADTDFQVCLFFAHGASSHVEMIGTPSTTTETEIVFNKVIDNGTVANIVNGDSIEDVVVQLQLLNGTCLSGGGGIIASSGINMF